MFRKGNEKLKAQWAVEDKLLAAVEEAAEGEPTQKEADKQVDELAEELEKRLHVPANREESESRLKENLNIYALDIKTNVELYEKSFHVSSVIGKD